MNRFQCFFLFRVVVTFEKGVSTWLLEEPVYMQVSSYILGGGVDVYGDPILPIQSEWSTATESWILAYTCKDNEYLDCNFDIELIMFEKH